MCLCLFDSNHDAKNIVKIVINNCSYQAMIFGWFKPLKMLD